MSYRKSWLRVAAAACSFGLIALYVAFQPVIAGWRGANRNELMSGSKMRQLSAAAMIYADAGVRVPPAGEPIATTSPAMLPGSKSASALFALPLRPATSPVGPATAPTSAPAPAPTSDGR